MTQVVAVKPHRYWELCPVAAGACDLHCRRTACLPRVSFSVTIRSPNPQQETGMIMFGAGLITA